MAGGDVSGKRKGKDVGTGLQWYTRRERSSASAYYLTNACSH